MGEIGHFGKNLLKCMKFDIEQAGLWLKPNTASQLKPDMQQADISSARPIIDDFCHFNNDLRDILAIQKTLKKLTKKTKSLELVFPG